MDVLSCLNELLTKNNFWNNIASTTYSINFKLILVKVFDLISPTYLGLYFFFHKNKILNNTKDGKENV